MSTTKPTPILLDTDLLSGMVTEILAIAGAPKSRKASCLNRVAALILGRRQNWGVLTSHAGIVRALHETAPAAIADAPAASPDIVLAACLLAMHEAGFVLDEKAHEMARHLRGGYLPARSPEACDLRDTSAICKDILDNHSHLMFPIQMQAKARMVGMTRPRAPSAASHAKASEIWWQGQAQILIDSLSGYDRTPAELLSFLQSIKKDLADWLRQERSKSQGRWFWVASMMQGAHDQGQPVAMYERHINKLLGPDMARQLLAAFPQ